MGGFYDRIAGDISEYLTKFRSTSLDLYLADRRQSNKICSVETTEQNAIGFGYLAGTFFFFAIEIPDLVPGSGS